MRRLGQTGNLHPLFQAPRTNSPTVSIATSTVTDSTMTQLFNLNLLSHSNLFAIDAGETRPSSCASDKSSIPRYAAARA
jgi:hypothetical protein